MGRFRRMVAPIQSTKHYVPTTRTTIASASIINLIIAHAAVAPASAATTDVLEGSVVKAVFMELWLGCRGIAEATTQFVVVLEKLPTSAVAMTAAQILNLGAYPNKKNILYTTQGVISRMGDGGGTIPVLRQFFMIPKGKQRMGLDDRVVLNIASVGETVNRCGIATYKEYT